MILLFLILYALWLVLEFCVIGTVIVLWIGFYLLAFLVAVMIEIFRAVAARRKPRKPPLRRPPPQARFSDRR